MSALTTLFNIVLEFYPQQLEKKRNRRILNEKEKVKVLLIVADLLLYIDYTEDPTRKILELINEFGKIAGLKINIQKSL